MTGPVLIEHRRLTRDEAKLLHEALKTTANIIGYTARELAAKRDVFVAMVGGRFAGATFSNDLAFGWTEIAVVYVLDDYRGCGTGRALMQRAIERAQERCRNVYMQSANPTVLEWMRAAGFSINGNPFHAPLGMYLHMIPYNASLYRNAEAWRKRKMLLARPRLMSGVLRRR